MPSYDPPSGRRRQGSPSSTELSLTVRVVLTDTESLSIPVRFVYQREDPFAVTLEFPHDDTRIRPWVLSRDVLRSGLQKPSGQGDVRVWPPCPCHHRGSLRIMLLGEGPSALLDVPAKPLRNWLEKTTCVMVPPGRERQFIDWGAELNRLLLGN